MRCSSAIRRSTAMPCQNYGTHAVFIRGIMHGSCTEDLMGEFVHGGPADAPSDSLDHVLT